VQTTDHKTVYLVEIQRRQYNKNNESFRGVAFSLENQQDLSPWLLQYLSKIRFTQGVAKNIMRNCQKLCIESF
jgi:hypothetical protein